MRSIRCQCSDGEMVVDETILKTSQVYEHYTEDLGVSDIFYMPNVTVVDLKRVLTFLESDSSCTHLSKKELIDVLSVCRNMFILFET